MSRVLIVDDDRPLARALAINLKAHGYDVTVAHDGRAALTEAARAHPA
ncbi:MAG: DNA-binding response regulator, partial [Nakamurella sp.]